MGILLEGLSNSSPSYFIQSRTVSRRIFRVPEAAVTWFCGSSNEDKLCLHLVLMTSRTGRNSGCTWSSPGLFSQMGTDQTKNWIPDELKAVVAIHQAIYKYSFYIHPPRIWNERREHTAVVSAVVWEFFPKHFRYGTWLRYLCLITHNKFIW